MGLGSLLAMTVLLDIVASAMPKSNSIPLLGSLLISFIGFILTVQTPKSNFRRLLYRTYIIFNVFFRNSGYFIVAEILVCALAVAVSMGLLS